MQARAKARVVALVEATVRARARQGSHNGVIAQAVYGGCICNHCTAMLPRVVYSCPATCMGCMQAVAVAAFTGGHSRLLWMGG